MLTVVSERIAGSFNWSGASRAIVFDISKAFDWVYYAGLLHKLIRNFMFSLFSSISSFLSELRVVLDEKCLQ